MKRKNSLWLVLGFIAYGVGIYAWLTARGVPELTESMHSRLKPHRSGHILIYDKSVQDTLIVPGMLPAGVDSIIVENMAFLWVQMQSAERLPRVFIARHMGGMRLECQRRVNTLNLEVADMAVMTLQCKADTLRLLGRGMGKLILAGEYNYVVGKLRDASLLTSRGQVTIHHRQIQTHDGAKVAL